MRTRRNTTRFWLRSSPADDVAIINGPADERSRPGERLLVSPERPKFVGAPNNLGYDPSRTEGMKVNSGSLDTTRADKWHPSRI